MQLLRRLSSRERDDRKAKQRRPVPPDERQEEGALPEPLTDRELDILRLLALGKTNREVARELWLSLSTVKRHVEHIIAKLGGSDRTGAAVRAVELGLLPHQEEEKG